MIEAAICSLQKKQMEIVWKYIEIWYNMAWAIFMNIFNIILPIFIMNNCCNINYKNMKPIKTNRKVHHHVMKTCTLHTHTHILCK